MVKIPDLKLAFPGLDSDLSGRPDDLETWIMRYGRYDHALAYSWLIWPPFTEHEGCVFLGSTVPEGYAQWKAKCGSDTSSIEAGLNHRHLIDLFWAAQDPSHDVVSYFGHLLRETWAAKLAREYPDRQFVVEAPDQFDIATDNPSITFYSRPAA